MNETTLDVKQLIKTLRKRKGLIGKILIGFVVFAAAISVLIPPTYEGEVLLRVKQQQGLADSLLGDIAGGSPMATKQLMSTYAEILKSRIVVEQTIRSNSVGLDPKDPEKGLEKYDAFVKRITTQPVKDTEILRVKVTAPNAADAQVWTNSLVDSFLGQITALSRKEQSVVREFIGERLKEARNELERAEKALAEYKTMQKVALPTEETRAVIDRISNANQLAAQNEVAMAAAQGKLANARRQLGSQHPGFLADGPLIQQLKGKLTEQELELAKLRQNYTEKHPRVLAMLAAVAETKLRLTNEVARVVNAESPAANPVHVGLVQARIQAEAEMAATNAQRQALQTVMANWEIELAKLPSKEQGLARVMRDALVAQEIYSMLAKRYEEARISEVMQPTNTQVVNPAITPEQPILPRKTLNVAIASLLGMFCGVGAAFFLEYMNRTVRTAEEVKEYLGLPVLGVIPDIDKSGPEKMGTSSFALKKWQWISRSLGRSDQKGSR